MPVLVSHDLLENWNGSGPCAENDILIEEFTARLECGGLGAGALQDLVGNAETTRSGLLVSVPLGSDHVVELVGFDARDVRDHLAHRAAVQFDDLSHRAIVGIEPPDGRIALLPTNDHRAGSGVALCDGEASYHVAFVDGLEDGVALDILFRRAGAGVGYARCGDDRNRRCYGNSNHLDPRYRMHC